MVRYISAAVSAGALVSESSPDAAWAYKASDFNPLLPSMLPMLNQKLTSEQIRGLFRSQAMQTCEYLEENGIDTVVIRDHAFSEYFMQEKHGKPAWPSILEDLGMDYQVVVTYRHPLDSYLGLASSFPGAARLMSLEEYSRKYINYINSVKSIKAKTSLLSIENLAQNSASSSVIMQLIDFARAGEKQASVDSLEEDAYQTSGASGRISQRLRTFPRKIFISSIRKEALESSAFRELLELLRYKYDSRDFDNWRIKVTCIFADIVAKASKTKYGILAYRKLKLFKYIAIR